MPPAGSHKELVREKVVFMFVSQHEHLPTFAHSSCIRNQLIPYYIVRKKNAPKEYYYVLIRSIKKTVGGKFLSDLELSPGF